jgi:hypothetical protein
VFVIDTAKIEPTESGQFYGSGAEGVHTGAEGYVPPRDNLFELVLLSLHDLPPSFSSLPQHNVSVGRGALTPSLQFFR